MRKSLLALVLLLTVGCLAFAQIIYEADSPIIEWDPSTTRQDGTALPAGAVVTYEVGWSVSPVADRAAPDIVLGETSGVSIMFDTPGFLQYAVTGRTKVVSTEGTEYSDWLWSDLDGYPGPWLVTRVPLPNPPKMPQRIRVN